MRKDQKIQKHFKQKEFLNIKNKQYLLCLKKFTIDLIENDITSNILINNNKVVKAIIYAKENGFIAGLEEVVWFLNKFKIKTKQLRKDGEYVKANEVFLELTGNVKNILKTERITLNLLQRMSGIATKTKKYIKKSKNRVLICSTRKNLYGLLDKKAVSIGGGGTHRLDLNNFILVKDNHLKYLSSSVLDKKAQLFSKNKVFWEVEVKDEKQAYSIVCLKPDALMFDNFKARKIKKIIRKIKKHFSNIIFEASGQINEKNIKKYSKSDVDIISCGSLTHSVKALDISLDIL